MIADWKEGAADVISGDVEGGLTRAGDVAKAAERAGWESTGVSAFRDTSVLAAAAIDYRTADHWIDEGLRYADSIEQTYCAHLMRATSAMVSWAGADPAEAQRRAQQAVADKGCRRGASMARWALGYVDLERGDLAGATGALTEALRFGETSGGDRVHPAAPVGARRGGGAGRRSEPGLRDLPGRPRACPGGRGAGPAHAVRGHRRACRPGRRPAGRGRDVPGRVRRPACLDPGCRRGGARPRPRAGRARRRRDRCRPDRPGIGRRRLGSTTGDRGRRPGRASTSRTALPARTDSRRRSRWR